MGYPDHECIVAVAYPRLRCVDCAPVHTKMMRAEIENAREASGLCRNKRCANKADAGMYCRACADRNNLSEREVYKERVGGSIAERACSACGNPGHNVRTCPQERD